MSSRGFVLNLRSYPLIGTHRAASLALNLYGRLKRRNDPARQHAGQSCLRNTNPPSKGALRDLVLAEVGDELLHAAQYAQRSYARQA